MNYTIFNTESYRIEKLVSCPKEILHMQFDSATQAAIEGVFDESTHYIDNGVPVAMPPKPSEYHVFDYTIKQWIDPRAPDTEWPLVRAERDRRLQASDWTQLPDVPLSTKEAWAAYRQALRDVTEQPDPFNITWPATRPGAGAAA